MINRKNGAGDFTQQFAYNSNINISVCNTSGLDESITVEILNSSSARLVTLHTSKLVEAGKTLLLPQVSIKANEVISISANANTNVETNISIMEESVLSDGGGTIGVIYHTADGVTTDFDLPSSNKPALDFSKVDIYISGIRISDSEWALDATKEIVQFTNPVFDTAEITIKNTIPSGV